MEGVQNLRKAVYEYVILRARFCFLSSFLLANTIDSFKLKAEAAEKGSAKHKTLSQQGINYLYRCELSIIVSLPRSGLRGVRRVVAET